MTLAALAALKTELNANLIERREVVDGALLAMLAGEHVLLLGPPGTAKSALVRAIASAFEAPCFETLLTKFSTPEEVFGALSLKALEQDRYVRNTSGMLPEAPFAFLDEVFKGNSAILNSLLALMNERTYHNGGAAMSCPLISLFGASNEMPESKTLDAMYDRFLVRYEVNYVQRHGNLKAMLLASEPTSTVRLSLAALQAEQAAAAKVSVTDQTVEGLITIRNLLAAEGLAVSDRRLKRSMKLVRASAHLNGETSTTVEDLMCLTACFWQEPKDRAKVARIIGGVADPFTVQASDVVEAAHETISKANATRGDRKVFVAKAATAVEDLGAQLRKLDDLKRQAGKRAGAQIDEAKRDIEEAKREFVVEIAGGLLGRRTA